MNASTNRQAMTAGFSILFFGSVILLNGCATMNAKPYVSNDTERQIETSPSDYHRFEYVRLENDKSEIVLYGKVAHVHAYCEREAHVDLVSIDKNGTVLFNKSLALRKQSHRVRGWHGAAFRARINRADIGDGTLVLAFHDADCYRDMTYDCGGNQAKVNVMGAEPAALGGQ